MLNEPVKKQKGVTMNRDLSAELSEGMEALAGREERATSSLHQNLTDYQKFCHALVT
jgi:hypothetical protein